MSDLRIVGMGFVGLPLALAFDDAGHDVVGYDVDQDRIRDLTEGRDPTNEASSSALADCDVTFTSDPEALEGFEYAILTVPTPIDMWSQPDLGAVEGAGRVVGQYLSKGSTVVLESTVYPGATREVLIPALESESGLSIGNDFAVGYSPERHSPGPASTSHMCETSKLVGATDDRTRDDLVSLYESIIDAPIHPTPRIETAEASKCLENVQRDVNISLINEFVAGCWQIDVDLNPWAVLEAARTKPAFHNYRPGIVGGHCIPVDPHFLVERFEKDGFHPTVMEAARRRNDSFPATLAEIVVKNINSSRTHAADGGVSQSSFNTDVSSSESTSANPQILILGFAYKANINDSRNHALKQFVSELKSYGVSVAGHDSLVGDDRLAREFNVTPIETPDFTEFDAVVVTTLHDDFKEYNLSDYSYESGPPYVLDLTEHFSRPIVNEDSSTDVS